MDPFSALSAAAAIAQFVHMSVGLVSSAYDVYTSVSGLPAEDEQLEFVMSELSKMSDAILSAKPAIQQNDAEKALARIADKCHTLAGQLLVMLERIKVNDPRSIRKSAAAALRNWWSEKEKKQLKAQADECRELLQVQLAVVMGSDTIKALKKLAKTGQTNADELASLQRHVRALRQGVTLSHIGGEVAAQLTSLLRLSDSALNSITSHRILNHLSFPEMHRRYGLVGKAYSETFEWIFEELPQKEQKALRGRTLFREWLESRNGIFHIAGKPGAGKSTLMKSICKHEQTKQLLESWAEGRKLVVGKFFFWRLGSKMENSITALLQTLLYEALEQCTDLIQDVLPQQWSRVEALPWQAPVNLHLDDDEIRDAFDRLLDHRNLHEKRCFCLFIDGLDELQESYEEGYKQLTQLLSGWTKKVQGDIKICVSSREFDVFLDSFSGPHGIRLQDLTYDDILIFVREKLESNENFLALEKPEGGGAKLISQVTERSSGVFLWVALVVKLLDDACDDGDTFAELQRKADLTPSEVEDLFQQLFDSIHKSDRDQSAQSFAIVLRLLENKYGLRMSLLRYSLLDEYNADPEFALKPDFEEQRFLYENENEVRLRLKRARRQLYKRCKGLLEVIQSDDDPLDGEKGHLRETALANRISLTHRSVQEFLLKNEMEQDRSARLQGFDVSGAIYQTFVAELALLHLQKSDFKDFYFSAELPEIIASVAKLGSDSKKLIQALWNVERIRNRRIQLRDPYELSFVRLSQGPLVPAMGDSFSISHCAADFGLHQYFISDMRPSFVDDGVNDGSLVLVIIHKLISGEESRFVGHDGRNIILRWIFQQGCCPNQKALSDSDRSLWYLFLSQLLSRDTDWFADWSKAMQIFLEFGAYHNISISASKTSVSDSYQKMVIHGPPPEGTTKIYSSFLFDHVSLNDKISQLIESRGGQVTLRDFIANSKVVNKESLLALLDGDSHAQHKVTAPAAGLTDSSPNRKMTALIEPVEAKSEIAVASKEEVSPLRDRITAEQVAIWIRSALGNPLLTFALGREPHY